MVDAPGRRVFVGRGIELARLRDLLAEAATSGERIVVLAGELGIGKSRLVARFSEEAVVHGARVLHGRCIGTGNEGIPYAPFVEILRELVRQTPPERLPALLGPGRVELTRLLPEVATRAADAPDLLDFDRASQARLFELIIGVLQRLSSSMPVAILIEDLHRADRSTRDLLAFLVRALLDDRVLLVLTIRTDEHGDAAGNLAFVAELQRESRTERLDLHPFTRDEVEAQAAALLAARPDEAAVERLVARSDGNPFYVEELLLAGALGDHYLPPVLSDVLSQRIASVSDPVRAALRVAAVAGRRIDDELLSSVLEIPVRTLGGILREAVDSGILVHREDGDGRAVEFRHALLQEVVLGELFAGERVELHAAFAAALEARASVSVDQAPGEISRHWDAARRPDLALDPTIRAAEAAEHVYAFEEARRLWARAAAHAMAAPDAAAALALTRDVLLGHAADAALLAGDATEAIALGEAAVGAVDPKGDPSRLDHLRDRLRWYRWEAGDRVAAAQAVDAALREIPADRPSVGRARALAQHAGILLYAGEYQEAVREASAAIDVARAVHGAGEEALALGVLGWSLAVLGDPDSGIARFREGRAIAERLGSVQGIALAAFNLTSLLDRLERTEESLDAAADGYATTKRLGVARAYGGLLLSFRARAEFLLGRWEAADATTSAGLRQGASGRAELVLAVTRARLLTAQGAFEEAATLLTRSRAIEESLGGTEFLSWLLIAEAELASWEGRLADVRAIAEEAIPLSLKPGPPDPSLAWLAATVLRAEADAKTLYAEEGTVAGATNAAEALEHRLIVNAPAGMDVTAVIAAASTDQVIGLIRAEEGRLKRIADPATWAEVAEGYVRAGHPYPSAYARYREAEAVLTSRGPRAAAAAALASAAAIASDLGAVPLLGLVQRLARQARLLISAAGVAESGPEPRAESGAEALGLTGREAEVLRLVAGGWSNQQIADELFITRKTASVHVSNIMAKLGVNGRAAAIAGAHRLGLVVDPPPPPIDAG
ncbi:MAG: AAA family ATPase [Candidatus Limnocylindrales bacterium]